ncbi:MAG: hypothetical protein LBR53_08455 [Deltaproteobacteria bacterium]|jgi:hypothetical protein|nr:hypothetical protein [Deltaproteobacteria bacterium]
MTEKSEQKNSNLIEDGKIVISELENNDPVNLKKKEDINSPFFSTYILAGFPYIHRPVPETSPTRYLGGHLALNVVSPSIETIGEAYALDYFYCFADDPAPLRTWGEGDDKSRNTLHIFRDYGIYNCADILIDLGFEHAFETVYCANHFRAIADLVYQEIFIRNMDSHDYSFTTQWLIAECVMDVDKSEDLLKITQKIDNFPPKDKNVFCVNGSRGNVFR